MKTLASKSGLIITLLLVIILAVVGYWGQRGNMSIETRSVVEKQSSNSVQSKLNLKGMTRHLLDFYK